MNLNSLNSPWISSALVIILFGVGIVAVYLVSKKILRIIHSLEHLNEERRQQLRTIVLVFRWGLDVLIVIAALLMLLSTLGLDITPLLTSVGVAGLAVSLGAQTLVKDLIGGLLVVMENQYLVGDSIQVQDVAGTVEQFTLRATHIRDTDGLLHIVPNGEVRVVGNMTKGWSRALVDIGVAYEEDIDQVQRVLEKAVQVFAQDPVFESQLLEPPQVLGPINLGDWAFTMRVTAKTQPGKQWSLARELRKRILAACELEGITLPYPRQEVWVRNLDSKSNNENE